MTITINPMTHLYDQLNSVGIAKSFAKKVLPDWWDDDIATSASGLQQAHLYFSRAFNIDLSSLEMRQSQPQFSVVERKFKLSKSVTEQQVSVSAHYVTALAKIALLGIHQSTITIPLNPNELRTHIVEKYGRVNLDGLLSYCAEVGVAVLHVAKVPGNKMTGLAVRIDGKFAIVLSQKKHPAYLLFHLAHEIGHIAQRHLVRDGFIVDDKIGASHTDDADEQEADAYAIRLLNGNSVKYTTQGNITSGKQLFTAAKRKADEANVDIGHIILNFCNAQNNFPLANMALRYVVGSDNGADVINRALFNVMDTDLLSEEQLRLLQVATSYNHTSL